MVDIDNNNKALWWPAGGGLLCHSFYERSGATYRKLCYGKAVWIQKKRDK